MSFIEGKVGIAELYWRKPAIQKTQYAAGENQSIKNFVISSYTEILLLAAILRLTVIK